MSYIKKGRGLPKNFIFTKTTRALKRLRKTNKKAKKKKALSPYWRRRRRRGRGRRKRKTLISFQHKYYMIINKKISKNFFEKEYISGLKFKTRRFRRRRLYKNYNAFFYRRRALKRKQRLP